MDSDFEAFRRDRKIRHRQTTTTERPEGNKAVWEALEQQEEKEMRNQMLNAEVDDFFSDATRLAANIVTKVSEHHDKEISDQLRRELEEFLVESIRHATNMINRLPRDTDLAESIVEPNLRNLSTGDIDLFRAEGTAQLDDKHLGRDLFGDIDDEADEASEEPSPTVAAKTPAKSEDEDDLLGDRLHLDDGELGLDYSGPAADDFTPHTTATLSDDEEDESTEADEQAEPEPPAPAAEATDTDEPAAVQAEDAPPPSEEDELPLAALFDGDGQARKRAAKPKPKPKAKPQSRPKPEGADELREALLLLVKQGVMTKDQARAAYRAKTRRS